MSGRISTSVIPGLNIINNNLNIPSIPITLTKGNSCRHGEISLIWETVCKKFESNKRTIVNWDSLVRSEQILLSLSIA